MDLKKFIILLQEGISHLRIPRIVDQIRFHELQDGIEHIHQENTVLFNHIHNFFLA